MIPQQEMHHGSPRHIYQSFVLAKCHVVHNCIILQLVSGKWKVDSSVNQSMCSRVVMLEASIVIAVIDIGIMPLALSKLVMRICKGE